MSGHQCRDELVAGRYLTGVAGAEWKPSTQAAANGAQPCFGASGDSSGEVSSPSSLTTGRIIDVCRF